MYIKGPNLAGRDTMVRVCDPRLNVAVVSSLIGIGSLVNCSPASNIVTFAVVPALSPWPVVMVIWYLCCLPSIL